MPVSVLAATTSVIPPSVASASLALMVRRALLVFMSLPIPHWPLPAVRDLTRDGRLSTYLRCKCTQAVQGFIPGKMRTHGTPSKATITN